MFTQSTASISENRFVAPVTGWLASTNAVRNTR